MIIVTFMFITDPFSLGYYKSNVVEERWGIQTFYRTEYPFKTDKDLIGTWLSIGSVENFSSFNQSVAETLKPRGEYYMVVKSDGTTSEIFQWTKGLFIHKKASFTLEYKIKELKDKKFLFIKHLNDTGTKDQRYSVYEKYSNEEYKEDLYVPPVANSITEVQLPQGNINKDMGIKDVLDLLGSPLNYYIRGKWYFGPSDSNIEDLPNKFSMDYGAFEIHFVHGHLEFLEINNNEVKYKELVIGDSIDEVFTKIPEPIEIITSQSQEYKDYTLYKIASGQDVYHYFKSQRDNMELIFENGSLDEIIVGFVVN